MVENGLRYVIFDEQIIGTFATREEAEREHEKQENWHCYGVADARRHLIENKFWGSTTGE